MRTRNNFTAYTKTEYSPANYIIVIDWICLWFESNWTSKYKLRLCIHCESKKVFWWFWFIIADWINDCRDLFPIRLIDCDRAKLWRWQWARVLLPLHTQLFLQSWQIRVTRSILSNLTTFTSVWWRWQRWRFVCQWIDCCCRTFLFFNSFKIIIQIP